LESAESVFLYGVGASSLVVEDILQKWSRVGKPIIFEKDIHVLLPQLVSNEKKKVLWLVSNSGRSADVVALAELAKNMNIEIIALTQFGNNPLSKIADVLVQTSRPKEITNRSAATNSLLAQFATIDIIFYFYMAKNESLSEKVKKTREAIQDYFMDSK
jgi:DNA-binding MurR/RpiR family transcriptional regulator